MATPKQLKEHLKDEQEPFTLNIYLSERGYLVKCLSSNNARNAAASSGCCQINLFKNLWNKKTVLNSTRVVKSVVYKLVSGNNDELSCKNEDEFDQIADSSSSRASNLGILEPGKNLVNRSCRTQGECIQDKQIDLMSMLNKLSSDKVHQIISSQESPPSRRNFMDPGPTENVKGNFVLATFPWKLLGKSLMARYTLIGFKEAKGTMKTTILTEPSSTLQYFQRNQELIGSRRNLPPLFNLSDEKTNDGKNVGNKCYDHIHWFIGLKRMGNLTEAEQQQIYRACREKCRSGMGFFESFEEWGYCKVKRRIGLELGDTIMDEIMEQEVIHLLKHSLKMDQLLNNNP